MHTLGQLSSVINPGLIKERAAGLDVKHHDERTSNGVLLGMCSARYTAIQEWLNSHLANHLYCENSEPAKRGRVSAGAVREGSTERLVSLIRTS